MQLLQGISQTKRRVEFPIVGEDYTITFGPNSDGTSKMIITRVYPKRLKSDKRLVFMKTLIDRARKKPKNRHLRKLSTALKGKSLIFTFPQFN